jgi:U3 small nucleolar RNA-associated protein 11
MFGSSALKNAVKRVTHKERAQPSNRKRFGLLEKHKDYVVRAKDYNTKQKNLKILKKKASERNPDEFYFSMKNSHLEKGVHRKNLDNKIDSDMIALLKTQDLGYLIHFKL